MTQPIYKGELQLARWSDTSTGGAQVTFWLPDGEALEAFKALTARKGGKAGQILAAMIVAVDEEGTPEQSLAVEMKGGMLSQLAGQFVRNPEFGQWLEETDRLNREGARDMFGRDMWLKRRCGIESKKALDHSEAAANRFHELVRKPFVEWQQRNGRAAA